MNSIFATLFLLFLMMPICANSKTYAVEVKTSEMRLRVPDMGGAFLEFPLSHDYGFTQFVGSGTGYLSCYRGRIDYFRLNFIIDANIARHITEENEVKIGVRRSGDGGNTIFLSPAEGRERTFEQIFGFKQFVSGYPNVVFGFDRYSISKLEKLYISSTPGTVFFEELKRGDRLAIVTESRKTGDYSTLIEIKYQLKPETANRFIMSCLESP